MDEVIKISFKNINVSLILVQLNQSWQQVKQYNAQSTLAHDILAQALATSCMLMSNVKLEGSISLQIRSKNHALSLLLAECTNNFSLRGIAKIQKNVNKLDMKTLAQDNAQFIVNLLPSSIDLNPYQGIIPLTIDDEEFSIEKTITNYLQISEQVDSRVWLANNNEKVVGMLLQKIPSEGGYQVEIEEDWNTIKHLASTITHKELLKWPLLEIVENLFNEYIEQEKVIIQEVKYPYFACTCSIERAKNAVKIYLSSNNLKDVFSDNKNIEINCDFCAKIYSFTQSDCDKILHSDTPNNTIQ